jgi:hypothetical protein
MLKFVKQSVHNINDSFLGGYIDGNVFCITAVTSLNLGVTVIIDFV